MIKKLVQYFYGQGEIPAEKYPEIAKFLRNNVIISSFMIIFILSTNLTRQDLAWGLRLVNALVNLIFFLIVFYTGSKTFVYQNHPDYLRMSRKEKQGYHNKFLFFFIGLAFFYFYVWQGIYSSLSQGRPILDYFSNLWVLFFLFWGFGILFGCLYMAGKNHLDDQERERQLLTPKEENHENSTL